MFQLLGNLFAYSHPVLINTLRLDDLFLTAEILRKRHTYRLLLFSFYPGALIGDDFIGRSLDDSLFFRQYVYAVKVKLTLSRIRWDVLFTRWLP